MITNSPRAWILAIRPYSLGAAVIPVAAASALAYANGLFQWLPALLCLLFALLMQITANLVNDLFDFLKGSDQADRLGPDRAFAKGYITLPAMKIGIALVTLTACCVGAGLLWFGGWPLILVGVACVLFAYLYTAGPFPLAYNGLGDLAVIIFFGIIPVGFTYYLQAHTWNWEVVIIALACGFVIDTMMVVNNFRDRQEDAACNKRTIVVCLGAWIGRWGYLFLGTAATLLCLGFLFSGRWTAALLPLIFWLLFFRTWRKMVAIDHGDELNVCLGETARNLLLFGALLTLGLLLS